MKSSRRGFLKLMGTALGTVVLASCGSGTGGAQRPLPNGYRFYRLFTTGQSLPSAGDAAFIPPSVKIHDHNQIIFHAGDDYGRTDDNLNMGLYEILMDYNATEPIVAGLHKIVRVGDQTADGRFVTQVQLADLNAHGSVAVRVLTEGEKAHSLYLERNRANGSSSYGLQRVLGFQSPTPDVGSMFGAVLGNFDLFENDDLLVASHWAEINGAGTGESIFYLPKGEVNSQGTKLLTAGDPIPGTDRQISKIGLIHANNSGAYAAQLHTDVIFTDNLSPSDTGSAIVKGNVTNSGVSRSTLVAVSAGTSLSTAAAASQVTFANSLNYGPRLAPGGDVAMVQAINADHQRLRLGQTTIAGTGDSTPTGMIIDGIGGPVIDANGLVYFVARNGNSDELLVSNGIRATSVLKTGVRFDQTGPTLVTIAFGYAREQVDSCSRLVFIGEFDDGSLSVILGVPL